MSLSNQYLFTTNNKNSSAHALLPKTQPQIRTKKIEKYKPKYLHKHLSICAANNYPFTLATRLVSLPTKSKVSYQRAREA